MKRLELRLLVKDINTASVTMEEIRTLVCQMESTNSLNNEKSRPRRKTDKVRHRIQLICFVVKFFLLTQLASGEPVVDIRDGEDEPSLPSSSSLFSAEVCQMETFQASCASDEVLIIRSAILGRLKLGRCVTGAQYEMGCHTDVLLEMDGHCSGRQRCEVRVDDASFKRDSGCHRDLKDHLWITYDCIKVTVPSPTCDVLRQQSGIISNFPMETSKCGATESPWVIEVGRGQRIGVTLYDFGSGSHGSKSHLTDDGHHQQTCRVYATIRETGNSMGQSRTVCGGLQRVTEVLVSSTERIELRILNTKGIVSAANRQFQAAYFLLRFKAFGCADPVLSKGVWMKRLTGTLSDTLTIGCDDSNLSWQLTCKDNEWKGNHGNCSTERATTAALGMPYAISTFVIVVIAMTVSCVILLIGILCIKRRMRQEHDVRRLQAEGQSHCDGEYSLEATLSPEKITIDSANASAILTDPSGNEYARMRLQRMADYAGSPPYGFDAQSYGTGCGYKYPIVEHVYESPDSLRREDPNADTDLHHTARLLQGQRRGTCGQDGHELQRGPSKPSTPSSTGGHTPLTAVVHGPANGVKQNSPSKAKNAGNYSL